MTEFSVNVKIPIDPRLVADAMDEGSPGDIAIMLNRLAEAHTLHPDKDHRAVVMGSIFMSMTEEARDYCGILASVEGTRWVSTDTWCDHYTSKGHCGLCGNSGIINTFGIRTVGGVHVGGRFWCLCPNGQKMRENQGGKGP